jgi:pyruvate kinase
MIAKCNLVGKPVVTATQMMESMIKNARPTRAEASDVANAVLDGTDCVMLSGETANGLFPVNTVNIMRRICEEAEGAIDYGSLYLSQRLETLNRSKNYCMDTVEAVCSSAVKAAIDMKSPLILALTETGFTARLLAKYRPPQTILAVTASETAARQLQICRGVVVMLTASFQGTDSVLRKALNKAKEDGENSICIAEKIVLFWYHRGI